VTPKIEELRRTQRILKRQIQSRTADLEKANDSLQAEISRGKQIEKELKTQLQERIVELVRINENLKAETSGRAQAEQALHLS